jgi:uncharacterized membrane protein
MNKILEKLKNKSAWFSVLSTVALSVGLALSESGVLAGTAIGETLIAVCAALTTAGVVTAPAKSKEGEDAPDPRIDTDEEGGI